MSAGSHAMRTAAVAALLEKEGIACDGVAIAGAGEDVAVIQCREVDADRLAAIANDIRRLGFLWVTIDLAAVAPSS
jgi:hypothetical protein